MTGGSRFGYLNGTTLLHERPADFNRLSRYHSTGLVWLLDGRLVVALTAETATIKTKSGAVLTYRKTQ
jgi:hypothetical protein